MKLEQAERQLQEAQGEVEEAEARRSRLREEVEELGQLIERLEGAKARALAAGDDERLRELREERQDAARELEELRGELPMVEELIQRRERAVGEAELELVEARRAQLRSEAEALGEEIREHLREVADLAGDLRAVISTDASQNRRAGTLRDRVGRNGASPPFAKHVAGFSGSMDLLEQIETYLRRFQSEL